MIGEGGRVAPDRRLDECEEIARELAELLRQRDRISLEAAALAGQLAEVNYGDHMGSVNTAEWMRHEFKLGYQQAADLVGVGLVIESLSESADAAWRGEIGFQHLVFMARTKRALGATKPFDEPRLLEEARGVSVGRFWHVCQEARHALDPEGVAREQRGQVEQRALRINQQQDGMVTFTGVLDPLGGAAVRAALEPLAKKTDKQDDRTRERRLADAWIELSTHAMRPAAAAAPPQRHRHHRHPLPGGRLGRGRDRPRDADLWDVAEAAGLRLRDHAPRLRAGLGPARHRP